MKSLIETRTSLKARLEEAGWTVSPEALQPLTDIDFTKLVHVMDHEEFFLEKMFLQTLLTLRASRASTPGDQGKITADDVKTALLMLGEAAARQSDATLSKATREAIKDSCGFC